MKKYKGLIIAGVVLAALAAFCLWYTRPRSWRDIAEARDEETTSLSASNNEPYFNSAEDFGFYVWIMDADQAEGAAIEAVTQALDSHTCRASLRNLFSGLRNGYSIDHTGGSVHLGIVLDNEHWEAPSVFGNGQVYFGNDLYYVDSGLYQELAQIVREYGTFRED